MIVLGSSSSGNCYLLENDTECLVVEAGVSLLDVKKALDFNVRKIVGVLVSHVHNDHSKYIEQYLGICPILKPYEVVYATERLGRFTIRFFPLVHDVPNYGFYIMHPDIGKLVYITDTEYCKYRFKELDHILVEANHDMQFVNKDLPNYEHILQGHMSLQTTKDFISTNDNIHLRNVVLLHLSSSTADKALFRETIQKITSANVYVAEKGMNPIELSLPF